MVVIPLEGKASPPTHAPMKNPPNTRKGPQVVSKLTGLATGDRDFDEVLSPPASLDWIAKPVRVLIGTSDEGLRIDTTGVGGRAALPTDPAIGFLCHDPLAQSAPSRFRHACGLIAKTKKRVAKIRNGQGRFHLSPGEHIVPGKAQPSDNLQTIVICGLRAI